MIGILAVIPARGGSKGVIRKNVRLVGGVPLIAHSIIAARKSRLITRCIISTDDREIIDVARSYGGDVPFIRPAELASDTASSVDVLIHALNTYQELTHITYDIVVLLQPTTPLRSAGEIDGTIQLLVDYPNHDSAIAIAPAGGCNPMYLYRQCSDALWEPVMGAGSRGQRRQDMEKFYIRTGAVYAVRTRYLLEKRAIMSERCLAHVMSEDNAINIDTEQDLFVADQLMRYRQTKDSLDQP